LSDKKIFSLIWFNQATENDPEQQQAVLNIASMNHQNLLLIFRMDFLAQEKLLH